jgi:predicted RNase H-like HicB family nuclease
MMRETPVEDQDMARPVVIHADWDPEAAVWVATTQDLRGLVTEAETIEVLRAKLPGMILDLLEENGIADLPASIEIIAARAMPQRSCLNFSSRIRLQGVVVPCKRCKLSGSFRANVRSPSGGTSP